MPMISKRLTALFLLSSMMLAGPARSSDDAHHKPSDAAKLYARDNLIAWCIVPFDSKKRGP